MCERVCVSVWCEWVGTYTTLKEWLKQCSNVVEVSGVSAWVVWVVRVCDWCVGVTPDARARAHTHTHAHLTVPAAPTPPRDPGGG